MTELQTTDRPTTPAPVNPALPAAAYLASLRTDVSRRGMTSALNSVAAVLEKFATASEGAIVCNHDGTPRGDWRLVNWQTLNAANIDAIMAKISGAPATRNKALSALRGVARAAYKADLMSVEVYQKIGLCKRDDGQRELSGRAIESWEYESLMRACCTDPTPAGARDGAMIAIAYYIGCRRAELAGMLFEEMTITDSDHAEVKVIGKRNKQRTLDIDNGALHALQDWLAIRGDKPGAMFFSINKGGRVIDGPRIDKKGRVIDPGLTTTALDAILIKRARQAGIKDVDWHDMRRTVISELWGANVDGATIARIVGHSDIKTTQRYDRRGAEARRAGARRRSIAYYGRPALANS